MLARCARRMQKALAQMNPELDSVLSDIGGKTDLRIIRAICAGERDGARLAKLRDSRPAASGRGRRTPARAHRLRDGGARQAMQRRAGAAGRAEAAAVRDPPAVPPGQAAGVRRARQGWRHGPIGTDACADLKAIPENFSFCKAL